MDPFPMYKLPKLSKPDLFVPPPYCRKAEKTQDDKGESPSVKLTVSNPSKILQLSENLTDSSSKALEVKLNAFLARETESKMVFLLHLVPCTEEAVVQTLGTKELETSQRFHFSERIMSELVHYVKKCLKCDENSNPQLTTIFKKVLDLFDHKTVTAVPILKPQRTNSCSADVIKPALLVCFVDNKKNEDCVIKAANELFKFCLTLLLNTMDAEEEARQKRQYQSLLTLLQKLVDSVQDVNLVIKTMTEETRKLMKAQHGTFFLKQPADVLIFTKIFSSFTDGHLVARVKCAQDYETTRTVTSSGKITNMTSPITDEKLTQDTKYEIKNLLCFPVRSEAGIMAAILVSNKRHGRFDRFDEEMASILDVFGGSLIALGVKFAQNANSVVRNSLKDKVMLRRVLNIEDDEIQRILSCRLIHAYKDFQDFNFSPRIILQTETICFVLEMFEKLNFFSKFLIDKELFTRFVAHVKNACSPLPYHNWMHLFSTAHFGYLCLKDLKLLEDGYISYLEGLAFFLTCLSHDVDYRGTRNPFQNETHKVLESLYSSPDSSMERHRLSQVLRILNSEGCNFLKKLTRKDYNLVVQLLEDFCLATDLSRHFRLYKKQYNMVKDGYKNTDPEHRFVFINLLTTCADLSDHTKSWETVKEVVGLMCQEFFEKDTKKDGTLHLGQVEAKMLKEVCLPAFKLLRAMFPEFKEVVARIKKHVLYWECSEHVFQEGFDKGTSCLETLKGEDFDKKIEAAVYVLENTK